MQQPPLTPGPRLVPFPPSSPPQSAGPLFQTGIAGPVLLDRKAQTPLHPADALAHDARNSLTALRLITGLLESPGVLHAKDAHLTEQLHAVEQALGRFVERFTALGKAPSEAAVLAESSETAGKAVLGCLPMLQAAAGSSCVVHALAESNLPPISLSDEELLRVLTNLVKNAGEAMPEGGTIRITARRALSLTQPAVLIHVADDGPGIPAFALGAVFEPGFSSKPSGAAPVGLGLAIVRELVEAAGGKVRAASRRRHGTTFELRIPCHKRVR